MLWGRGGDTANETLQSLKFGHLNSSAKTMVPKPFCLVLDGRRRYSMVDLSRFWCVNGFRRRLRTNVPVIR